MVSKWVWRLSQGPRMIGVEIQWETFNFPYYEQTSSSKPLILLRILSTSHSNRSLPFTKPISKSYFLSCFQDIWGNILNCHSKRYILLPTHFFCHFHLSTFMKIMSKSLCSTEFLTYYNRLSWFYSLLKLFFFCLNIFLQHCNRQSITQGK